MGCAPNFVGWAYYIENNEGWEKITDGLSKTLMFVERAGIPTYYESRKPRSWEEEEWGTEDVWPRRLPNPHFKLFPVPWGTFKRTYDTSMMLGPHGLRVNRANTTGVYSFHNGVNVAMCDSSVDFKSEDIDVEVMKALVTARDNEIVSGDVAFFPKAAP